MRWSIFICGAGLLCLGAWVDNMRGPLIPAVTEILDLSYQEAALIISLGNLVAMVSTWLLMPILNRTSQKTVGLGVLIYTTLICASACLATTKMKLFLWGALLGGSISTMGSLSNLFVQSGAEDGRRGQMMSALHSIYGLSSFFAPWVAGVALSEPERWPWLFVAAAPVAMGLAIFLQLKIKKPMTDESQTQKTQPMTLEPLHMLAVTVLVAYVIGEVLISTWLPSYLVNEHRFSIRDASFYTSMFFAAMFVSRVACWLWSTPRWHRVIIWGSILVSLICFTLGRLTGWLWLLPLAGLLGPFFPLYVTWVSLRFPDRDRSLIIWMLSLMQAALAVINFAMGRLADYAGFNVAFWLPVVMMLCAILSLKILENRDRHAHI
jgi:fucose permease